MKKAIVRIAEGLGNQLFMYAHAYAFSKKNNYELFIDDKSGYFQKKNIRSYHLNNFNIDASLCEDELKFNNHFKNLVRKFLLNLDKYKRKKKFLLEPKNKFKETKYTNFNEGLFSNLIHIEGYFESEKYFIDYKSELKKQFTIKDEKSCQNNKFFNQIKNEPNIVSICIRQNRFSERKGNMNNIEAKKKSDQFMISTINYINRATSLVDQKIKNAKYFIWSNDFTNLRSYFDSNKFTFVDLNLNKTLTDFYLLLNCTNFIVGPTSFHWWPAWLNKNTKSIIIRPKDLNVSNNKDFWPKSWISV